MINTSKILILISLIFTCFTCLTCGGKSNKIPETLDFYRQQSIFTDPGQYADLYKDLPGSYAGLCELIKSQFIHPDADLPKYRGVIPAERVNDDASYPDAISLLEGLLKYNPAGLIPDRKPSERLLVTCRYHSVLLASILRSRGIPVRLRYGYAVYLLPGYHVYHVVCEIWNEEESRWMLVDPDRQIVDIKPGEFEFAGDVWKQFLNNKLKTEIYGVPGWWGEHPIYSILCHDIASVLGGEYVYRDHPPIAANPYCIYIATKEQKNILTKQARLLKNVDNNFDEIKKIYEKNGFMQFKK